MQEKLEELRLPGREYTDRDRPSPRRADEYYSRDDQTERYVFFLLDVVMQLD